MGSTDIGEEIPSLDMLSDEELARRLQLEEDREYQQQLEALSASWRCQLSVSSSTSTARRPGILRKPLLRTRVEEPNRPQWREIVAQGSAPLLTSRFFPPLTSAVIEDELIAKSIASDHQLFVEKKAPDVVETECGICAETQPFASFISTVGCEHKYCSECCKRHAEVKVSSGLSQIGCPHPDCGLEFDPVQCAALLSPVTFDILTRRQTEAAFPSSQKVFCPFPDCSAFMEKPERSGGDGGGEDGEFAECWSCHRGFCLRCSTVWHVDKTCAEYRADVLNVKESGDEKLRELAETKKWQICSECQRMIELNEGCFHMTCLCGNEFCYTCGAKWKNKRASCSCKLWDEGNIITPRVGARRFPLRGREWIT